MKLRTTYGNTRIYIQKPPKATKRVLVLPGFGESTYHVKPLVTALAAEGFEALTFRPPRRTGKEEGQHIDPILRQSRIILEVLRATLAKGEKVHALAHSLGAAAVLKAAQLQPEYFASLILMQPAGIVDENQSVYELAGRATKKLFNNQKVARLSNNNSSGRVARTRFVSGAVIAKQPLLAWREAAAAGRYRFVEDLQQVSNLGIPIHLVASKGDEMFDHVRVAQNRSTVEGIVQSYTLLEEATSNHDTFWIHPQNTAVLVGKLI